MEAGVADWSAAKGFPGSISGREAKGLIPGDGQLVWISVEVTVPEHQTLDVAFGGAARSRLHVDGTNEPAIEKEEDSGSRRWRD